MRIEDLLIKHEAMRLKPYHCTAGALTIGVGRNLDSMGLSEDEVYYLLQNDIRRCEQELLKAFEWFAYLDTVRQDAMMDMCFNLGISRLRGFEKALEAMEDGDYEEAAVEFLDSNWADQVGQRAITITNMIRTGEYDEN
jgi:lysozyme